MNERKPKKEKKKEKQTQSTHILSKKKNKLLF